MIKVITIEREREREQNILQQQQLLAEITTLEQNATNPEQQTELDAKKQKLKELEVKEKELNKSLPIATQITNLEREIKDLENKPTRTQTEETLLISKKKRMEELLRKQDSSNTTAKPKDKIALYVGLGVFGLLTLLLIFILARNRKRKQLWKE